MLVMNTESMIGSMLKFIIYVSLKKVNRNNKDSKIDIMNVGLLT